jgi:hypothetical protein
MTQVKQGRQVSAQERAMLFAQATRQNVQTLPAQTVGQENQSIQFTLPKSRLLSKIYLNVEAVATLKSSAAAITLDSFSPYKILRRVSLDMNNGFSPFIVGGRDLAQYNLIRSRAEQTLAQKVSTRVSNYVENTASVAGTDNAIKFTVQLPITLNDRDPVGLILLQNDTTQVTLTVDVGQLASAYVINSGNADQVIFKSMTVTPVLETYTIPPIQEALPDLSVLKLVNSKADTFAGNGQNIVKLNVGTIYRKLLIYLEDNNGVPLTEADLSGNIELIFNQADIPYSIKPSVLAHINSQMYGVSLPAGLFVFDFSSYAGQINLSGSRDYIDTERLTEFWLRFSSTKAGKVTVVSENLSRLR